MINEREFSLYNEVFFFDSSEQESCATNNELKDFLLFLKSQNVKSPLQFSFSPETWSLTGNLIIKESIMLDSISTSFSSGQNLELGDYISQLNNPLLGELSGLIGSFERMPSSLDFRTRKLANLFKAIIKQCPFLFLQNPETYLIDSDLILLNKLIQSEVKNGRTVFLSTKNREAFDSVISKVISRGASREFLINDSVKNPQAINSSLLKFHIEDRKKAA